MLYVSPGLTKVIEFMNNNFYTKIKTSQWLILICFLGTVLRLFNLEVTGLWMDEIHTMIGTDPDRTILEVIDYSKRDQPPMFYLLIYGWFKIFPYNDFYGRLFALIIGVLGIVSLFFLGKEFKNNRVGLMCAFLTMINYFHIEHSRQVRFYPLVFLLASLSYLFFIRILKSKRPVDFIFYILSTAVLLNAHLMGIAVFSSQFMLFIIIIIWKKIRDVKFITYSLLSGVAVGLSFLHWLPVVFSELQVTDIWIPQVKWYFPAQYYWYYFRDIITCFICGILIFFAVREYYFRMKSKSSTVDDVVIFGWMGFGVLIPLIYSLLRTPMLQERYTFIILPAVFLVVALGFDTIKIEKLKLYIIPILFFSFLENALFIKSIYFRYPSEQWREVTQQVMKTDNNTQFVFSRYAWYFRYYFKVYKSVNSAHEPQYADFNGLIKNANSVWILKSTLAPDEGLTLEQEESLNKDFQLVNEFHYVDSNAKHYVRR